MSLRELLKTDLKTAMKARQPHTVSTLRTVLAAIDNAEAVDVDPSFVPHTGITRDVPRRVVSEEEMVDILRAEVDDLRSAMVDYEQGGRPDEAEILREKLIALTPYLESFS
ncbi:MAG: GatB/YqeY domain-containing protein [Caldilineaceae bacterium]|nr:GatB/YqeY domain-containing protein [Caldilineaceae bacterium]